MSNKVYHCANCHLDAVCDSVMPFEPERERAFAVNWKCSRCEERSLVVSPLGPWLAPAPGMCLQCGHEGLIDSESCLSCGISIAEVLSPEEFVRSDDDLLQSAQDDFARGTCRRALTLVNYVLQRNPRSGDAWSIKGQFFEYLGFQRALKAAMQEAVRLKDAEAAHPRQAGRRRWWEFWK